MADIKDTTSGDCERANDATSVVQQKASNATAGMLWQRLYDVIKLTASLNRSSTSSMR
jgi:hypothetical protein